MISCPDCKGEGTVRALGCGRGGMRLLELECPSCLGKKELPDEALEWKKIGEKMRQERVMRGVPMRTEAARRGLDAMVLSEMERGLRKPEPT